MAKQCVIRKPLQEATAQQEVLWAGAYGTTTPSHVAATRGAVMVLPPSAPFLPLPLPSAPPADYLLVIMTVGPLIFAVLSVLYQYLHTQQRCLADPAIKFNYYST